MYRDETLIFYFNFLVMKLKTFIDHMTKIMTKFLKKEIKNEYKYNIHSVIAWFYVYP